MVFRVVLKGNWYCAFQLMILNGALFNKSLFIRLRNKYLSYKISGYSSNGFQGSFERVIGTG